MLLRRRWQPSYAVAPLSLVSALILVGAIASFPAQAAELLVLPDGSGPYPTIQAAIDAASAGDHVILANGVFRGEDNRDLYFRGKAITVRSRSGQPGDCVIDAADITTCHRGFIFCEFEDENSVVRDLTIRNADVFNGG